MHYYQVTEQNAKDQQVPIDPTLAEYRELFIVEVSGNRLHYGFGYYKVENNILDFSSGGYTIIAGNTIKISAPIDALLVCSIYSCSRADLANYLISENRTERQLAEIRNKQEKKIKEMIVEEFNASLTSHASNRSFK
jgi:hypothetical protein